MWSNNYGDSEWCKAEAANLVNRQNAGDGFHYVVAKVDPSPLPGLLRDKLWVDFSGQPEGPSGTNLLRVLYGILGRPLSPEAVKMAAQVDDQMHDGLLSVKARCEMGDPEGLVALTATDDTAWTSSPMLLCEAAEGLIKLDRVPDALDVLVRAIEAFPKAVRPGNSAAWRWLAAGTGRTHSSSCKSSTKPVRSARRRWVSWRAPGSTAIARPRVVLYRSRDYYQQAFAAFSSNYYTGVNAASKSLLLGDKERGRVGRKGVGDRRRQAGADDYWKTATIAEVLLIEGKIDAAAEMYKAAVRAEPLSTGNHASTRKQAALLLDKLGATDAQKILVLGAFPAQNATSG